MESWPWSFLEIEASVPTSVRSHTLHYCSLLFVSKLGILTECLFLPLENIFQEAFLTVCNGTLWMTSPCKLQGITFKSTSYHSVNTSFRSLSAQFHLPFLFISYFFSRRQIYSLRWHFAPLFRSFFHLPTTEIFYFRHLIPLFSWSIRCGFCRRFNTKYTWTMKQNEKG